MSKKLSALALAAAFLFAGTTANAQSTVRTVQPFACTSGGSDTASSAFININGRFPLQVVTDGSNGVDDRLGAIIVVPANTPANSLSFEMIPSATTPLQFIQIEGTWALPNGQTGLIFSGDTTSANAVNGNQVKGKNLQFTFDLHNLTIGVSAPAGATITSLFLNVEVRHATGNKSGSTLFDNFFVNGQPVPVKIPQSAGCPKLP